MHPNQMVRAVVKRWWIVLLVGLAGFGVMLGLSLRATPTYQSTASVYFSLQYGNSANDLSQGSNYTLNQMASYAALVTTPAVLDPVIATLSLDTTATQLATDISATPTAETVILDVTVTRTDPQSAADIANAVATQLGSVVRELSPTSPGGSPAVDVTTVAQAAPATAPSSPKTVRNAALGLAGGLLVGVALVLVRERLDQTVRSGEQVAELTGEPILGVTYQSPKGSTSTLIAEGDQSGRAESYRQLRTNLRFIDAAERARVVAVTSALAGEGKSTTAANLAIAFASSRSSVLLVEADLRRPGLGQILGLESAVGLTDLLAGDVQFGDVVQDWGGSGLQVLLCGTVPPNPSELLGSPRMAEFLEGVTAKYDVVIVDTPPLLPVTDGAVVATLVDGVIVVVRAGHTHRRNVAAGIAALRAVDARILGCVLTRRPLSRRSGENPYSSYSGTTAAGRRTLER